ncbi:MAG: hypothetical protein JWL76_1252 [Thermoleophilia bacterium]|nr:hypothetical protein [Thermoleophilia bacterium]
MDPLVIVHVVAAVALLVLAIVVGVWGLVRARQIAAPVATREGRWYAQTLQLSHTLVLATGLLGIGLFVEGHRSDDPLHVRVYGPFMLVAIVAAYAYRTKDATLNVRVFAIAALVVFALGLRAFVTGG